jgi:hypothetical protein
MDHLEIVPISKNNDYSSHKLKKEVDVKFKNIFQGNILLKLLIFYLKSMRKRFQG